MVRESFDPGELSVEFRYLAEIDSAVEGDEWFTLILREGPEFILGRYPTTAVRIIDRECKCCMPE